MSRRLAPWAPLWAPLRAPLWAPLWAALVTLSASVARAGEAAPGAPWAPPPPLPCTGTLRGEPVPAMVAIHDLGGTGVRWGGYLQLEYVDSSDEISRFDLHRLVLAADASITDRIDLSAEIEFEHGGISDEFAGEVVLEKAEVAFHMCDALTPRLGWVLVPFGRYNLYHDDPINDFTVRPFTARYLVPTGFGQPGVGVSGALPFGCGHVLTYDAALTNGYKDAFTADEGVGEARQNDDQNDGKQVWGRAAVRWRAGPLDALETGISGTWGRYDDEDRNEITGVAFDALARWGPFEAKGEYVAYDIERDAFDPVDAVRGQSALWLEAGWHFFPCSWRRCRNALVTETSHFTLLARWQTMDLDDRATGAAFEDDLDAFSVGLNYRITERSVFRVDYTWFDAETADDRRELTLSFSTYF